MGDKQPDNVEIDQKKDEIDNSWMNEVDKICKRAMQSLESTQEITVNIGKSAINCLDEMHSQSDTISRINTMVNSAMGSLSDTARCLKDMASPVTCIISGMYDEYVVPNISTDNVSTDLTSEADVKVDEKNPEKCKLDRNTNSIQGDGILANFSRASCDKLDDIIDQLQFNKDTTEELVKVFAQDKHRLIETVDNIQNLQDELIKVQSAMSNF